MAVHPTLFNSLVSAQRGRASARPPRAAERRSANAATQGRLALLIATLLTVSVAALLVVPLAHAIAAGGPEATASVGVKKKVKKLKQQVAELQGQVEELANDQDPPTGPAGGDLTGNYPSPLIAQGAVGTDEVGLDALSGADLAESSLGQVPSAAAAGDADTVDGHHAVCPTGTQLYIGACWETQRRSPAETLPNAASECGDDGRYLPSALESREYAFDFRSGETGTILEWTEAIFQNGAELQGIAVTRIGGTSIQGYQAQHPYRCVTPLVR